jgi:hypothetical protein
VKAFDGTTQVGTATADSSGAWTITAANLAAGKHSFTATDTVSGTTSSASSPLSVTVDRLAPAAPVLVGDTVVNANQVLLTGTAEANSTLQVFDGTAQVGTATANSTGTWSMTTGTLASGSHSFTAKASDAAGNIGLASAALAVTLSSTPNTPAAPTIASLSSDSGVVGDHITSDSTPTLDGTAVANSTIMLFDGKTQVGKAAADSSGHWSLTTTALSDGAHNMTATDTDSSGHASAASSAFALTIDTHAPAAPTMAIYSQAGVAVGAMATDNDLVLKGTAEVKSTIDIFDAGKQIGTASTNSSGAWSFDTGHIASGSHSFTATAVDVAGVTGHASAAGVVSVTASQAQGTPVTAVGCHGHNAQAIATLLSDLHTLQSDLESSHGIFEARFGNELLGETSTLGAELAAIVKGLQTGTAALLPAVAEEMHANAAGASGNNVPVAGGTYNPHGLTVADVLSMAVAAAPAFAARSPSYASASPAPVATADASNHAAVGAADSHHSHFEMAHHFEHLWG